MRRQQCLLFSRSHSRDIPVSDLLVYVRIRAPDTLQYPLGLCNPLVLCQPHRALRHKSQAQQLQNTDEPCNREDNTPEVALAEKVAQRLGDQDANVRHDLRERPEEAPGLGRRNFSDEDRDDDDGSTSSDARYQSTKRELRDGRSGRLECRAQYEERSRGTQRPESTVFRRVRASHQGSDQASKRVARRDDPKHGLAHGDAFWEGRSREDGDDVVVLRAGDDFLGGVQFRLQSNTVSSELVVTYRNTHQVVSKLQRPQRRDEDEKDEMQRHGRLGRPGR